MSARVNRLSAVVFIHLITAITLHADGYRTIEDMPRKLTKLNLECHKGWNSGNSPEGWDSGNTSAMEAASIHLNDGLLDMIRLLVKTYYPKGFITDQSIKTYVEALFTANHFKESIRNPSGESQGNMTELLVLGDVGGDLEGTIADMVKSIVANDSKFNYSAWKERWDRATKAGN